MLFVEQNFLIQQSNNYFIIIVEIVSLLNNLLPTFDIVHIITVNTFNDRFGFSLWALVPDYETV